MSLNALTIPTLTLYCELNELDNLERKGVKEREREGEKKERESEYQ